jgi:hypothetical protein
VFSNRIGGAAFLEVMPSGAGGLKRKRAEQERRLRLPAPPLEFLPQPPGLGPRLKQHALVAGDLGLLLEIFKPAGQQHHLILLQQ